jgi:hypothetical protein
MSQEFTLKEILTNIMNNYPEGVTELIYDQIEHLDKQYEEKDLRSIFALFTELNRCYGILVLGIDTNLKEEAEDQPRPTGSNQNKAAGSGEAGDQTNTAGVDQTEAPAEYEDLEPHMDQSMVAVHKLAAHYFTAWALSTIKKKKMSQWIDPEVQADDLNIYNVTGGSGIGPRYHVVLKTKSGMEIYKGPSCDTKRSALTAFCDPIIEFTQYYLFWLVGTPERAANAFIEWGVTPQMILDIDDSVFCSS